MATSSSTDWFSTIQDQGVSWGIGKVLDFLLSTLAQDTALSKLIDAPFKTGRTKLELARQYAPGSPQQLDEIAKAKELFQTAANHYDAENRVNALCLAAVCCYLLSDRTGRDFFYRKATDEVHVMIPKAESAHMWATAGSAGLLVAGVGLLALSGGRPSPAPAMASRSVIMAYRQRKEEIQFLKNRLVVLNRCISAYAPIPPPLRSCAYCQHQNRAVARHCANCGNKI
jgi:hypothetical protein